MAKSISKLNRTADSQNLQKRRCIDAAFAQMADDSDYQKEALLISEEFARSESEALEAGERDIRFPHTK
jgi:hypothetical protein